MIELSWRHRSLIRENKLVLNVLNLRLVFYFFCEIIYSCDWDNYLFILSLLIHSLTNAVHLSCENLSVINIIVSGIKHMMFKKYNLRRNFRFEAFRAILNTCMKVEIIIMNF